MSQTNALTGFKRARTIALIGVAVVIVSGCAGPNGSVVTTQPAPPEGNAALLHFIADQPYVSAEAGYRAVYILWKREEFVGSFDEITTTLRDGKIIASGWNHEPGARLTRGDIGFMVCRACDIRTGINWAVSGLGRYAWRELQFKGIAGGGGELTYIRGGELVSVLAKAGDYMERKAGRNPDAFDADEAAAASR